MAAATATTTLELLLRFGDAAPPPTTGTFAGTPSPKPCLGPTSMPTSARADASWGAAARAARRSPAKPAVDALVRLLEKSGYDRPGHLDARSYSVAASGSATTSVWTTDSGVAARGPMRSTSGSGPSPFA